MSRQPIIAITWHFSQQIFLEPLAVIGASASCFGERYRDVLSQNIDENHSTQTSIDLCTVVCKQFSYSTCVCMCYIQFAEYSSVYVVCSYVESNSVEFVVAEDDDTITAVSPTRREAHEKTYGMRNRRRSVYASLKVCMLWFGCLSITTVHDACVQSTRGYTCRIHSTFDESSSSLPNHRFFLASSISSTSDLAASVSSLLLSIKLWNSTRLYPWQ